MIHVGIDADDHTSGPSKIGGEQTGSDLLFFVRHRREFSLGERDRVTHSVPFLNVNVVAKTLTACCGEVFLAGVVECVDFANEAGMPCIGCLRVMREMLSGSAPAIGGHMPGRTSDRKSSVDPAAHLDWR